MSPEYMCHGCPVRCVHVHIPGHGEATLSGCQFEAATTYGIEVYVTGSGAGIDGTLSGADARQNGRKYSFLRPYWYMSHHGSSLWRHGVHIRLTFHFISTVMQLKPQ
eukprot:6464824-Amphidinium_carterae.3